MKLPILALFLLFLCATVCAFSFYVMYARSIQVNERRRQELFIIYSEIADIIDRNERSKNSTLSQDDRSHEGFFHDQYLSETFNELYHRLSYFNEEVPPSAMLGAHAVQYDGIDDVVRIGITFIEGIPIMEQINVHFTNRTISYYDATYYSDLHNDPRILPSAPFVQDGKHTWFFYLYTEDQENSIESFLMGYMRHKPDAKSLFTIKIAEEEMNEIVQGNVKVGMLRSDGSCSFSVELRLYPIKIPIPKYDDINTNVDSQ